MKSSSTILYQQDGILNLRYQCLLDYHLLQLQKSHLSTNHHLVHQEEPLSRRGHRIPPLLLRGKNPTEEVRKEALPKALIAQRKSFIHADLNANMKQMAVLTHTAQREEQSSRTMKISLSDDPDRNNFET